MIEGYVFHSQKQSIISRGKRMTGYIKRDINI